MVTLLRGTLESNVSEGIRFAELLSITDGMVDFNTFKKDMRGKAKFSSCSKHLCNHGITVSCKTCQRGQYGNYCIECFLKGDHKDHDYAISQNSLSACKCGHKEYSGSAVFCPAHTGY